MVTQLGPRPHLVRQPEGSMRLAAKEACTAASEAVLAAPAASAFASSDVLARAKSVSSVSCEPALRHTEFLHTRRPHDGAIAIAVTARGHSASMCVAA